MLFKRQIANIEMDGDAIKISSKDLNLQLNYQSIKSLYINNEMDETAREMELSLVRLERTEPELDDLLRIKLDVDGIGIDFIATKLQGEPLAHRVEDEFRNLLLESPAITGEFREKLSSEDPKEVSYPVYFHGCRFDDDFAEEV